MINQQTLEIIATAFGNGQIHDFNLFKQSKTGLAAHILCLADSGYQGLLGWHANSQTPVKKSKLQPLTAEQKTANRKLAGQRIFCEHVIGKLKIFRILSERYRNRRRRFSLRFNLIAAIYNIDLQTKS